MDMESEHDYLSTACFHELHEECGKQQHDRGDDGSPHCKWCDAECVCPCHWEEE